ncbi:MULTISPECIES: hypothetical protein [Sorangium]|uniref:hypothetical protein n=1 Tax=Sorangium TaxID=39643 RepID=UPI003D9C2B2E
MLGPIQRPDGIVASCPGGLFTQFFNVVAGHVEPAVVWRTADPDQVHAPCMPMLVKHLGQDGAEMAVPALAAAGGPVEGSSPGETIPSST